MKYSFSIALLVLALTTPAQGDDARHFRRAARVVTSEIRRYLDDAKRMANAPRRWDARQWQRAALSAGAIGGSVLLDDEIASIAQRNRSAFSEDASKLVTPFGGRRAEYVDAAMILAGLALHDTKLRDTGRDALEASILAGRIVTPLIKETVGRSRPFENEGSLAFDPFSGNESFPSGHATNAFAVASVVAGHYDGWIVRTVAYSLATSVAVARVHDDVHWTSDVVTGAIIGTAIGRGVVARHRGIPNAAERRFTLRPLVTGRGAGVLVSCQWGGSQRRRFGTRVMN